MSIPAGMFTQRTHTTRLIRRLRLSILLTTFYFSSPVSGLLLHFTTSPSARERQGEDDTTLLSEHNAPKKLANLPNGIRYSN